MKILNPADNITRIVSLIDNARKFVVMVSPFTNLNGWENLKTALIKASERGIDIKYYVRGGEARKGLEYLNLKVFEVPMLHAKIFFSEKEAMITSFHLLYNEDINWAGLMENEGEYNELVKFFENSVLMHASELA